MAKWVAKETRPKIFTNFFTSFLLACLVLSTPVKILCVKTENPGKQETQETTDGVKAAKKVGLYTLGTVATVSCAISLAGLYIFLTSLKDIKSSVTKNAAFEVVKKAIHYFSSAPQFNKYIIPGIIFTLSANSAISLVGSIWAYTAGYKTKISVLDYAKFTLLPKFFKLITLK